MKDAHLTRRPLTPQTLTAGTLTRRTLTRRTWLAVPLLAPGAAVEPKRKTSVGGRGVPAFDLTAFERRRVVAACRPYLKALPITVTASGSPRSAGGKHDYFSEGDYWWPDPKNPAGPYVKRDGLTNPDNFDDHRKAMRRLSVEMPALTAAWIITRQRRYAQHALKHLRAWFINPDTMMSPHLKYAQAITNKVTGRSIGVIDTIHLVEVARAAAVLEADGLLAG